MIERLEPGSSLDERSGVHYAHGATYHNEYPYPKTLAGALQLAKMPWDYAHDAKFWSGIGFVALVSLAV